MKILPLIASIAFVTSVHAQTPYAGMQGRSIKALSDQQIADLERSGHPGSTGPRTIDPF